MNRRYLLDLLSQYRPDDRDEAAMHQRLTAFVNEHANCFDRELSIGHITGSAWIINPDRSHAMLLHHRKLNRWLQPGGHSDGDWNTLRVAMREAQEESGLPPEAIRPVRDAIFDIDIHVIPARKHEAEHSHYDVRFLLEADDSIPFNMSDESNEIAWIALEDVARFSDEASMARMVRKTR